MSTELVVQDFAEFGARDCRVGWTAFINEFAKPGRFEVVSSVRGPVVCYAPLAAEAQQAAKVQVSVLHSGVLPLRSVPTSSPSIWKGAA